MANAIAKPECLRIPKLYQGEPALLMWRPVDGATAYRLEYSFDGFFDPMAGNTWYGFSLGGKAWAALDGGDRSWDDIGTAAENRVAYGGPGLDCSDVNRGCTWGVLDDLDETWTAIDAAGRTWEAFEALALEMASWDYIEAHFLSWEALEERGMTWDDFGQYRPPEAVYLGCEVTVPEGVWGVWFRLTACGAEGEDSAPLQSTKQAVIARQMLNWEMEGAETILPQINRCGYGSLVGDVFLLTFDPEQVEIIDHAAQRRYGRLEADAGPLVLQNTPGALHFVFNGQGPDETIGNRALTCLALAPRQNGTTRICLEHSK